ncbi:MAG TPA: efflux RND transporter permease subunit, partial [Thermomicrobiaceae bacterium]|nr:efflux RND transporter permease subunit [Thermomicrobiaceae bacterium]
MYRIAALSLRKRAVVMLAVVLIALAGIYSVTQLQTELLPNIDIPVLTVLTAYPGASPETVDAQLTAPITAAVRSLPGVSTTQSTSSEGSSIVVAQFDFGTNTKEAAQALATQLQGITLPQGATPPNVQRVNFNQFPVVQLSLTGANGDLSTLRQVALTQVEPALSALDGVGRVEVTGGADNVVRISLDPAKLAAAGITPQQVAAAIQGNTVSAAAGTVQSGTTSLPVRVSSQLSSLDALRSLVVGAQRGAAGAAPAPVTLGDLGSVAITPGAAPGITRTNGQPSVGIDVYLTQGANTVDTAGRVRDALASLTQQFHANGTEITPVVIQDQSTFIQDSINSLTREALLGAGFAIVVIFGFLLSLRATLVTAISIPLSMLIAFILLWWQGISLNIMTLGGIAVAVGRVVDDAIVVLESIFRHVQRDESSDVRRATLAGVREVALAITASSITTVAVFLPLGFIGGLIGEIFRPFALSVTFALIASLFVALTIVPVLASFLISRGKLRPAGPRTPLLQRAYLPILRRALARPKTTLGIAAVLFVASFGLLPLIGTSFLPSSEQKIASVQVSMPAGTTQDATAAKAAEIEGVIKQVAPVELIQTQIAGSGLEAAFRGGSASSATITVNFASSVSMKPTLAALRTRLKAAAGPADISVADASQGFGGSSNSVQVTVQGEDYARVAQVAQDLTSRISQVPNLVNVTNDVVNAKPEVEVSVAPDKAAAIGSTASQIAGQVRQALSTSSAGQVVIDNVPYPVQEQVTGIGTSVEALGNLPVGTTTTVPLSQLATITQGTGPAEVIRVDGDRAATISGTITSDATGAVTGKVAQIVRAYQAPAGVTISSGGVGQQQGDAFQSMGVALVAAVLLVYLALVATFGSLTTPFVILFSLPLAVIGVLAALALTGKTLGLPALIGVLMLVGIVVTNAIVLLELVIALRRDGMPLDAALIEGGRTRLRPILMTALATILALIPLALSHGGAIIASDLAVVVIGGLLTSTVLTLVVVPVSYKLIAGRVGRGRGRGETGSETAARPEPAEVAG